MRVDSFYQAELQCLSMLCVYLEHCKCFCLTFIEVIQSYLLSFSGFEKKIKKIKDIMHHLTSSQRWTEQHFKAPKASNCQRETLWLRAKPPIWTSHDIMMVLIFFLSFSDSFNMKRNWQILSNANKPKPAHWQRFICVVSFHTDLSSFEKSDI